MEIRILEERANPLLKRHEYRFEVDHATVATPSRDSVRGELSKIVKAPKDRVIIERMGALYGTATTRGDALVYETADAAKSITRAHILVRNGLKEKAAVGTPAVDAVKPSATPEAPRAEPAAEAPAVPKAEAKIERPSPPKGEHKSEHKAEHKTEHTPPLEAESKDAPLKAGHKGKGHKAENDATAAPEG
ncbi:MAG: 30S ribosomal protein S24e [Thermoplasmata archaeon]